MYLKYVTLNDFFYSMQHILFLLWYHSSNFALGKHLVSNLLKQQNYEESFFTLVPDGNNNLRYGY